MNIDLTGRTAVVSGSTQGIGFAIAAELARAGARVVVNGRAVEPSASRDRREGSCGMCLLPAEIR